MEKRISATEARIHFGEVMRRVVEEDEPLIVERAGKPEVVVLSIANYRRLRGGGEDNDWLARAAALRSRIRARIGDRMLLPSEEIVHEMREERDAQLLRNLR